MAYPSGLPSSYKQNVDIFNIPSTVTNTQWHMWQKPKGITMVNIICIGGGAGGGGGFTGTAGTARGGGGGGGGSAMTRLTIPASVIPDTLYVQVGAGGPGAAPAGGAGTSGVLSYVAIYPDTTATNVLCISGAAGAVGGGAGTVAAAGAGGAAGTIAVIGSMPLAGLGHFDVIAGQIGTNGGVHTGAIGTANTLPVTSILCMGGVGGAGVTAADFAGGAITAVTSSFLSQIRPINAAAGSFDGCGGLMSWKPLFSFCGMGGGSSNASIGGFGGNGAYGSGGGGGGGGTTGGTGGAGGSGLVIITSW